MLCLYWAAKCIELMLNSIDLVIYHLLGAIRER
jgi:hypothetical protein